MNKYVKLLSDRNIEKIDEKFDFSITHESSCEEYAHQAHLLVSSLFYSTYLNKNLVRVYMINDIPLFYSEEMIKFIRIIFNLAVKYKDVDISEALSYLISSIYRSYRSKEYRETENLEQHISLFSDYFTKEELLNTKGEIKLNSVAFAEQILDELMINQDGAFSYNEISIESLLLLDSFGTNISKYIDKILSWGHLWYLEYIIELDKNLEKNYLKYFDAMLNSLESYPAISILEFLYCKNLITEVDEIKLRDLIEKHIDERAISADYLVEVSKVENTIKIINDIIEFNSVPKEFKNVLRALRKKGLSVRRELVGKADLSNLHTYEFETEIPSSEIEGFFSKCDGNLFETIATYCIINFESHIPICIETRTKNVLHMIADVMTFKQDEGLIIRPSDSVVNDSFSEYYKNKIDEYVEKEKENIVNFHILEKENYYNYLLDFASDIFSLQTSMIGLWLEKKYGKSYDEHIYNELTENENKEYSKNYYIMLYSIIIQIENNLTDIYNILLNKKENSFKDEYLPAIFSEFLNSEKHSFYTNGIMYINYVMYDKLGITIRNEVAHGALESSFKDTNFLLASITALVISIGLVQECKND